MDIVLEAGTNGAVKSRFLRGAGLIAQQIDANLHFYLFDGHGDVVQRTDGNGTILKSYEYDAYGVERGEEPLDQNPFRYAGEYWDRESRSYYLRNRSYDPGRGVFTSEDPIRSGGNWYGYCYGNPVAFTDPLGLASVAYGKDWDGYVSTGRPWIDRAINDGSGRGLGAISPGYWERGVWGRPTPGRVAEPFANMPWIVRATADGSRLSEVAKLSLTVPTPAGITSSSAFYRMVSLTKTANLNPDSSLYFYSFDVLHMDETWVGNKYYAPHTWSNITIEMQYQIAVLCEMEGVDYFLVLAIILHETAGNPNEGNDAYGGLMAVGYTLWKHYTREGGAYYENHTATMDKAKFFGADTTNHFDPIANIAVGVSILNEWQNDSDSDGSMQWVMGKYSSESKTGGSVYEILYYRDYLANQAGEATWYVGKLYDLQGNRL